LSFTYVLFFYIILHSLIDLLRYFWFCRKSQRGGKAALIPALESPQIGEKKQVALPLALFRREISRRNSPPPKIWQVFFLLHVYINVAGVCGGDSFFVVEFVAVEWILARRSGGSL